MIRVFPAPIQEETLYSLIARYSAIIGYSNPRWVLQDCFGGDGGGSASPYLPSRLGRLVAELPTGHPYTVDQLIDRHTLLPYYARFVDPAKLRQARRSMEGSPGRSVSFALGLHVCRIQIPRGLQFCPECAVRDTVACGAPVWRRVHQLPGVLVCPDHGCVLRAARGTRTDRTENRRFVALDLSVPSTPAAKRSRTIFENLARSSEWLLSNHGEPVGLERLRERLLDVLTSQGWRRSASAIQTSALVAAVRRHTGSSFLRSLGCSLDIGNPFNSWLGKLCISPQNRRRLVHPLHYLIVLEFLGVAPECFFDFTTSTGRCTDHAALSIDQTDVEPTAGPCGNPLCRAYTGHPKFVRFEGGTTRVTCSTCGFSYRVVRFRPWRWRISDPGPLWEAELRRLASDPANSFKSVAAHLGVVTETAQRHAAGLGVQRPGWEIPARLCSTGHAARRVAAIERNRCLWLSARTRFPGAPCRRLIERCKSAYNFLIEHDAEWLRRHSPTNAAKRSASTVDDQRDRELVARARQAREDLMSSNSLPKRLSVARLSRAVVGSSAVPRPARTPNFVRFLRMSRESKMEFAKRRLRWALKTSQREGLTLNRSQIASRTGLSRGSLQIIGAELAALDNRKGKNTP